MTGQDWGSEGLASDQAGAKGPLHIMVHARQAWVLGSEALKVLLVCVRVCVCVCVCPATSSSNLQQAAASEPGWAGGLVKRVTFLVLGQVLWSEEISEVRKCRVVLDLCVCLLIWLDVFSPLMRGGRIVQLISTEGSCCCWSIFVEIVLHESRLLKICLKKKNAHNCYWVFVCCHAVVNVARLADWSTTAWGQSCTVHL